MRFRPFACAVWLLAVVACAHAAGAATVPDGVRLIETSPASTRFEVHVPYAQLVSLSGGTAGAGERVDVDGYSTVEVAGEAALPVRVIVVAVPPVGPVRVSGVGSEESVREGVDVATVPWVGRDGTVGEGPPRAVAEPECARLIEVGWMRHQRIARIELRPARYDAAARRLRVYSRIDIAVDVTPTPPAAAAPDSDAFEPLYRSLLVNYEQGRGWRDNRSGPVNGGATRVALNGAEVSAVPDTSVFIGRRWIKIAVNRTGFYRLPFSQFKALPPFSNDETIPTDSLRLFTWAGYPVLPESTYCDSCGFSEVALGVVDDADGLMNHTGDGVYFYGLGPSDWADHFDPRLPDTVYVNHPYETRNYYYLGVSTAFQPLPGIRRRIETRSGTPSAGALPTPRTFPARLHREVDSSSGYDPNEYPQTYGPSTYAWEKWTWSKVKLLNSFRDSIITPGVDITQAGRLRARLWSMFVDKCATPSQSVSARWNTRLLGGGLFSWNDFKGFTIDTPLDSMRTTANDLSITLSAIGCPKYPNLISVYWYDVFYARKFEPFGEKLEFRPPPGGGDLSYELAPFTLTNRPRLFDVSDPLAPAEITGASYTDVAGGHQLAFESVDGDRTRYMALPDTSFISLSSTDVTGAVGTSKDNLRSHAQRADYLVIYYDGFQAAADALAEWRRQHNAFRTKTVPISAIYDQFSGGRTDPTAIRNFLHAAYYNWAAAPQYVTFLGDASYDFKNNLQRPLSGQPGCLLPTYENGFELGSLRQFTTDDWLLNVDNPSVVIPDFLGGRLPATSASAAMNVVVGKVLRYEQSAALGNYRNRVMLIADDNQQGEADDPLHWTHVLQTTQLDTVKTPSVIDRDYIYLHTYPTMANFSKPAVRDSIKSHLNGEGVAVVNYIGHGSPFKLADESVLVAADAASLRNIGRLPLFCAASCDVGRFSDPTISSMGEEMLLAENGGAIGVVSATDIAYSGQNALLNQVVFQSLFGRPTGTDMSGQVAVALALAKQGSANSQKYQLMGDAALRLNMPQYWVALDIKDDSGADTTAIQQGRRMAFTGRVLSGPNGTPVAIDGTADVLIEDSAPFLTTPACDPRLATPLDCPPTQYYYTAGPVFRGTAVVHAGQLSGEFMVPIEARPGKRARIRAYVAGLASGSRPTDGAGDLRLRVATGTAPANDTRGPEIRLSFPNGALRVAPNALLRIDLSDSSGILMTEHTPQNGVIVTIDGNTTSRVEVTGGFRYNTGSFQAGSVTYQLPELTEGLHVVSVSAADNLAAGLAAGVHRSKADLEFEVVQLPPLRVTDTYLFPDPTRSKGSRSGGQFVVDTEGGTVDLQLRIFTVSGRLLRVLRVDGAGGQVQVPWDGLDAEGQWLANGLYLYKVVVRSAGSSASAGAGGSTQKTDAMGRFVIVNP